ncbi:MAG: nuclear transport factor 2 family protein [Phycisphaerales bacterium JB043]
MTNATDQARHLAEQWLTCWLEQRPDDIPLADDFVHTSPFGRIEGREHYLEMTKPKSAENTKALRILRVIAEGNTAAIVYEIDTPTTTYEACDWVFVEDGRIKEIKAYFDPRGIG